MKIKIDNTGMKSASSRVLHAFPTRLIIPRLLLWAIPTLFLGVFFFYPLARILWLGLNPAMLFPLSTSAVSIAVRSLLFTFYQATLSTFLTLFVGLPAAFLFARFQFRGKAIIRALTAVPFMLPTVVVAAGFNALLGPRGWINLGLMGVLGLDVPPIPFMHTLWAILLAHVFYNTTIVIRIVSNALEHLDPHLTQAARALGANHLRVLWHITLPLLRPAILAASLLVFIFDFTSFGVILLLGGPRFSTLEVEIYIQALKMLNLPLAALLSVVQLSCTLVFSMLYSRAMMKVTVPTTPHAVEENLGNARTWWQKTFVAGMLLVLVLLFVAPMMSLPFRSVSRLEAARGQRSTVQAALTMDYYRELFINRRSSLFYVPPIRALRNSLTYAGITVLLSLMLGFPAAIALARPGRLERLIDPFLMLPLGASSVTLGLGFIIAFNHHPLDLRTSPWLVPLAHTTIALPFVIRTIQPLLASIPRRYREAAKVLGAPPLRAWFAVEWPVVARATLTAAVFAFTISLGEFGATAVVSRPEFPTLPVAIYRFLSQPGGMNYGQAMAMATILMLVTTVGILLIERMRLPGVGEF